MQDVHKITYEKVNFWIKFLHLGAILSDFHNKGLIIITFKTLNKNNE